MRDGTPQRSVTPRARASTLAIHAWELPCQYCGNDEPNDTPCCTAWRNHEDYIQLWQALAGIRDHYRRGSPNRIAIDMWMEVDEFERSDEEGVEEEQDEARAAWQTLERIREDLDEDHPVSRAMDRWVNGDDPDIDLPDGV